MRGRGRAARAAFVLALAWAAPGVARELHWRELAVRARLDAEGALHVVERHAMVFNGDWNGGERTFRVAPGQALAFESLTRVDADGARHPLSPGDLSAVDQFAWSEGSKLRWRSRLPSDPPFSDTELVYEIAYTLSRILVKQGDRYLLDHDFAFPDRAGPIESFSRELTLDPAWKPLEPFSGSLSRRGLVPGESVVVRLPLAYTGTGRPSAGRSAAGPIARKVLFALLTLAIAWLAFSFYRREAALGRFAPLTPPDTIDGSWLDANLLSISPEEAGALWDETIGRPEVAAILARLSAQKKIAAEADGKKLTMRLLVPQERFSGYDAQLIKGLFFGGRKETDTDAIRAHYKSSGFDPVAKIRPGLEAELRKHADFQDQSARPARWPTAALTVAAVLFLAASVAFQGEEAGAAIGIVIVHAILWGIGAIGAYAYQRQIRHLGISALSFLWVPAVILYFAWSGARENVRSSLLLVVGVYLLRLAIVRSVFQLASTRNGARRMARRKALASSRRFFARELARPVPRLQDEWFPYVVAFELTGDADRWSRIHGVPGSASASGSGSSSGGTSSSGGGGSSPSWTGGGGAFGGAGASGSWAIAAGALAAGVASPSSSSSGGGGGGGGGGSSGGGGGGGW